MGSRGIMKAVIGVALASAIAIATIASAAAARHTENFDSTITIKQTGNDNFKGEVKSDSDDCVKGRRVTLFSKEGGAGGATFVVGHDRSDERGAWVVRPPITRRAGGGYSAGVEEKVVERGDHKHTCRFDESPKLPFAHRARGDDKAATKLRMKMTCTFGTCERARRALTSGSFKGRVRSSDQDCVDGRQIKITRKGGAVPGPVATTDANESGRWNVDVDDLYEGTYRAKTGRAAGCKTGKSKRWTLTFGRAAEKRALGLRRH
jgi:hypothetical protein